MPLTFRRLSARLDPLPFPARQRMLADTARSMAGTPAFAELLAETDAQGVIGSRWATLMAVVAGDDEYFRHRALPPDSVESLAAGRLPRPTSTSRDRVGRQARASARAGRRRGGNWWTTCVTTATPTSACTPCGRRPPRSDRVNYRGTHKVTLVP